MPEATSAVEGRWTEDRHLTERERHLLAQWYPTKTFDLDRLVARYGASQLALWACIASAVLGELDVEFDDDVAASSPTPDERGDLFNELLGHLNCEPIDWNEVPVETENDDQHSGANDA